MKKTVCVTIEEKIVSSVKALADIEGRNMSNMIEYILRQYLAQRDKL